MRLITITILTFAQSAFGGLIDLTPGGFNWSTATKPPPGFLQIGRDQHLAVPRLALFDTAIPSGWVSVPGVDLLNGGTYFDTDFPQLAPTATASLTWDFDGTIYSLRWILV